MSKANFTATFSNGVTSNSHDAACFFQIMKDRNKTADEIQSCIDIGRMCDPFKDWNEIQRIADSLAQGGRQNAAAGKKPRRGQQKESK